MHSLGNDFVVIDLITQSARLRAAHIKRIADRHFGIGCDQIITIEPPIRRESDFSYRTFNSDGSEAEQCGNGARCAAKFALDTGLITKTKIYADFSCGLITLLYKNDKKISAKMGKAKFIKLNQNINLEKFRNEINEINEIKEIKELKIHAVSIGNPHIICFVTNLENFPIKKIGQILSTSNDIFYADANVSFVEIINDYSIKIRVFERGSGETLSCGSAASAAVAVSNKLNLTKNNVEANFLTGKLNINIKNETIYLSGPAISVFSGYFRI